MTAQTAATLKDAERPEPGDTLKSYPGGLARGEKAPQAEGRERGEHPIVLSDPIPADELQPSTPYVIKDSYGRVMCVDDGGSGGWGWAYLGDYDSYAQDVLPLYFSQNPMQGAATLTAKNGSVEWPLQANGTATSREWTFWAKDGYGSGDFPVLSLKATLAQRDPDGRETYRLSWDNNGTNMRLTAGSGTWNWLNVSSKSPGSVLLEYTFHKLYVVRAKVADLLSTTWPAASLSLFGFSLGIRTADDFYEAVSDDQAMTIWNDSGLSQYKWKEKYFDCDDFSYVYKAQASKDAYVNAPEYGYAVGVIFGKTPNSNHAVSVFIDKNAKVRIIEPQTGKIVTGEDWKDDQSVAYVPYFVLM